MADVKLFRPQRLTDNPDGGGLATATEIIDGQVNNLFDDISRIVRVNGGFSVRKMFLQVDTPNTELYSGVHIIVQTPPQDSNVSCVLFPATSWNDERADAVSQVERYLDESVISRMIVYDRQLQGVMAVQVFQRPEAALPEIGQVYVLKSESDGKREFFRIQDIDHGVETFTDERGDFQVRVITLTISQPLENEFLGAQPNRYFTAGSTVIRKTMASDAARYKGVMTLAEDAAVGDLTIKVESIFAQLVPAATVEIPVADASPAGVVIPVASSSSDFSVSSVNSGRTNYYLLPGAVPNTVTFQRDDGSWNIEDDADGSIKDLATGNKVGDVNYQSGFFRRTVGNWVFNTLTVTYRPAAMISQSALTDAIPVDISSRGTVYVRTLRPVPAPGTLLVRYRAQGSWHELQDDGTGALRGDSGTGGGSINFATGTVTSTLGALPDMGSAVLYAWGAGSEYEIRDADVSIPVPAVKFQLESGNCEPGTLSIGWLSGGVAKTATADAAGVFSGAGTGRVKHATGEVVLYPALLPDPATVFTCDYEAGNVEMELFNPAVSGGSVTLNGGGAPWRPGSVRIDYLCLGPTFAGQVSQYARVLVDDGAGHLTDELGTLVAGSTVNYTTGQVSFGPHFAAPVGQLQRAQYAAPVPQRLIDASTGSFLTTARTSRWPSSADTTTATVVFQSGSPMTLHYKLDATVDDTIVDEVHAAQPLQVDLTPQVSSAIVPGGLIFSLGGRTYYDRDGTLYYAFSMTNGSGTAGGSINYSTGVATLTSWVGGIAPAFDVKALLTQVAPLPLPYVHGRTPGSPLRPASFSMQAVRYSDGAAVNGVADNNGNIDTVDMHGHVDINTGVFAIAFGRYVLDSSLTAEEKSEDWYDVADVDGDGYIWRPAEVMPGSIRFNCVVLSPAALDPEIIKINPVRLPPDGRVPIFRRVDTLVISDPLPYTFPAGLTAGQVVTLPRDNLDSVAVYDQAGLGVDPALYEIDLVAGEVTMATPLDLGAYDQPLVAIHSVEDMAMCLDAQINGVLTLSAPLTHAYLAGQSMCSSALVQGDAQARYEHQFEQNTWLNVWSDEVGGSPPVSGANYNDAGYPIEVLNRDAITQRWALRFQSSTTVNIVGETLGIIAANVSIVGGLAPNNPATGQPYFVMPAGGFGGGWATGNVIRFNTIAAGAPVWAARTVMSGPATVQDDLIRLQPRWDKD